MFTGLVETIGVITAHLPVDPSSSGGNGTSLTISTPQATDFLQDAGLGDSISVNGTCLTITAFESSSSSSWFKVGVAPETLRRTNLGTLTEGSRVNLERAVAAGHRMGGHFVQGHVDGVAEVVSVVPDGNALVFRFRLSSSSDLMTYIVEKGYVTLDGASLTVTAVDDPRRCFEVMLISYTQEKIVTATKSVGDQVNVEIDVVGKYVEKSVAAYFDRIQTRAGEGGPAVLEKMVERMVTRRLNERG